jgi:hypothetical protein
MTRAMRLRASTLRRRARRLLAATMLALGGLGVLAPGGVRAEDFFNNFNGDGVVNGVGVGTIFKLTSAAEITEIVTYHWNNGRGTPGYQGNIAIRGTNGQQIGSAWPVMAQTGQGGAPVNWVAHPVNFFLPAGTYMVDDSDHGTWSQNARSGHLGFTIVRGTRVASIPPGLNPLVRSLPPPPAPPPHANPPAPPPAPTAAGQWPQHCDNNTGAVAKMEDPCLGKPGAAMISLIVTHSNTPLRRPITGISFHLRSSPFGGASGVGAVVIGAISGGGVAPGSLYTATLPLALCGAGGQSSTWDAFLADAAGNLGDIGRYLIDCR